MIDSKLETLITLIEEKNYTNTAKKLFITQPAVTHHIKMIEKDYDIVLFSNPKTFELTKSGQILLEYAKNSKMQDELLMNTLAKQSDYTFTLGITPMAIECVTKNIISNLDTGKLSFNLYSYPYSQILKELSNGKLDFAIIDNGFDSLKYNSQFLFSERIIMVCNPNGQYANVSRLTRDQFSLATLILPDDESGLTNSVMSTMKLKNIKFKNNLLLRANSLELMKALTYLDDAVAFVYESSAMKLIEEGALKRVDIANFSPSQNFYLIYNKLITPDEKIEKFTTFLKESGIQ